MTSETISMRAVPRVTASLSDQPAEELNTINEPSLWDQYGAVAPEARFREDAQDFTRLGIDILNREIGQLEERLAIARRKRAELAAAAGRLGLRMPPSY